jgi:cyclopropane-fatty-acyl-phospholipid synthase
MDRLLQLALGSYIQTGNLRVTTAGHRTFAIGDGNGKRVAIRFTSASAQLGILCDPELRLGEAYMDGTLQVEEGSIADVLHLAFAQGRLARYPWWTAPRWLVRYLGRRIYQLNERGQSRRNVGHHYDLDGRLYSIFLDADRQYSCAYFEGAGQTLDDAQLAKKRHLAAKLLIEPRHHVLEIGSGWGGLALYLTETCDVRVKGVTLSEEQLRFSRALAAERERAGDVDFELTDYRDVGGTFDRIVSACSSM